MCGSPVAAVRMVLGGRGRKERKHVKREKKCDVGGGRKQRTAVAPVASR